DWPTTAWPMASRRRTRWPDRSSISASVRALLMDQDSLQKARSRRERIDDDVDRELRVVLGQEALVAPVVVPLAAVVLVAVEHAQAAVDADALEVVVHQVVAPAIELEAGRRRAVGEAEETAVERMAVRDPRQRARAEDRGHLRLERLREQPVDVVVAVVHEHEPAVAHVAFEVAPLGGIELDQAMARQVAE